MKLRNKKTGEIKDIGTIIHEAFKVHEVETLKSIEENWEDAPNIDVGGLPLIKDEKIRKVIRAWAEAYDIVAVLHNYGLADNEFHSKLETGYGKDYSAILFEEMLDDLVEDKTYAITELCGEKE